MLTLEFRKKIKKWFYHYKKLLAIPSYWHVRITTNDKIKEFANVTYDYQEKKFDITINPKRNKRTDVLKDSILHELIHILFTPATARLELLLQKIECGEKFNIKKSKKNTLAYEEYLVHHMTRVIINLEKEIKQ
jgi:hypothetical protein